MTDLVILEDRLFDTTANSFEEIAMEVYRLQARNNRVYQAYLGALGNQDTHMGSLADIRFLPISFFKTNKVTTGNVQPNKVFLSSGTSGVQSKHHVASLDIYNKSLVLSFELFYGSLTNCVILPVLPPPTEAHQSSLVYMVNHLMSRGAGPHAFQWGDTWDFDDLLKRVGAARERDQQPIVIALPAKWLEMTEQHQATMDGAILMETGGLKGGKEIVRNELHGAIQDAFAQDAIHSEYGMTELLSQAYSTGRGIFRCPPWMRVMARDITDPFSYAGFGQTGALNIIDLANLYSCSFVATDDLGRVHEDGSFEVLGRLDNSDLRGCNLMVG